MSKQKAPQKRGPKKSVRNLSDPTQPAPSIPVIAVFVNSDATLNRVEWPGIVATAVPTLLRLAARTVERQIGLSE